jgi:3-keto-L-gulonate-6-phosphate decarboxylase
VSEVITPLGGKIVVAGGINTNNINQLSGIPNIAVIIVGGGITNAENPLAAVEDLKNSINSIFNNA